MQTQAKQRLSDRTVYSAEHCAALPDMTGGWGANNDAGGGGEGSLEVSRVSGQDQRRLPIRKRRAAAEGLHQTFGSTITAALSHSPRSLQIQGMLCYDRLPAR
jgi:hypothetical protein